MTRISLALAVMVSVGVVAAHAQVDSITKGMSNPNAPIDVTADNFFADANAKTGLYSGNVVVHQGEVRMHANAVRVNVVQNKPDKIYAQGNVVVDAPSGIATGDTGVYDVNPRLITLRGHVVLTKDKNVMRGSSLTVNLVTGKATLDGGTGQGGRVQGLFTPASQTTEKP